MFVCLVSVQAAGNTTLGQETQCAPDDLKIKLSIYALTSPLARLQAQIGTVLPKCFVLVYAALYARIVRRRNKQYVGR